MKTLFIDLLGTERFSFIKKNMFCILSFPRSITDWFVFGLGWFGEFSVVIVRVIVGVLVVMIFVLIGHEEVLVNVVIYVAIFVVISVPGDVLFTHPVGDSELR